MTISMTLIVVTNSDNSGSSDNFHSPNNSDKPEIIGDFEAFYTAGDTAHCLRVLTLFTSQCMYLLHKVYSSAFNKPFTISL